MNPVGKTVLLYSGGVDSYALAALYRPDVLLHVDVGTTYGNVEMERLAVPQGLHNRLQQVQLPHLGQFEVQDRVLPGRNAHLVLLAAHYGDTIMTGAMKDDRVGDQQVEFMVAMNEVLAQLYRPQFWLPEGRNVVLQMPAVHLTKSELVGDYVAAGHDAEALVRDTFSCYYPLEGQPCHNCPPCRARLQAFRANGIDY